MPTFSDQDHQRTDYSILQNSPIVLYHRPLTMAADIDALHSNAADFAAGLADIFASSSRYHALFGRRLIMMLQVDECSFHLPPVGACPVIWNRKEFLDKSRT